MKKSLLIVGFLAVVAGTTGLLIGLMIARARHGSANKSAIAVHVPAQSPSGRDTDAAPSGEPSVIRFVKDPTPTPPFLVTDLKGESISTAALKGKVVIVNFWATWCPPCRAEIPELVELQTKYKDRLQVIGVSVDEDASPQEVNAFAAKAGINYPVVMGKDIVKEYGGVPALPTSFMVNKDGGVVQKHVGLLQRDEVETEIRALSGLPVNAKIETFADNGQIFLKNAALATDLPDVDMKGLTAAQKTQVLKRLNSETCTCGCGLTIAQCRINDTTCPISQKLAAQVVQEVKSGVAIPAAVQSQQAPQAPQAPATPKHSGL
jgi:thiol-disulfide isomerase/thioredoxin